MINFSKMTNANILNYMKECENEYEAIQNKINKLIDKLEDLDKKYLKSKEELNKRGYRI